MENTNPPPLIEKVLKLNSILESLNLKPQLSHLGVVCKKEIDSDVMLIELIKDDEYPSDNELNKDDDVGEEEFEGNHFDKFPTCGELAYHKELYLCLRFHDLEDISSVIDPRVSHVVLGKPFVELSGMTYDSSLGVVRLTNGNEEIAYKMPGMKQITKKKTKSMPNDKTGEEMEKDCEKDKKQIEAKKSISKKVNRKSKACQSQSQRHIS
ncbi:hypothetical protein Tco_1017057 [Tanacetum coccineum]|uniref:Uncharacterized protein n=1 Tax=Tanacetum coccineum TaxID=301880 RepID=A0ABQ5FSD8_9ASTR